MFSFTQDKCEYIQISPFFLSGAFWGWLCQVSLDPCRGAFSEFAVFCVINIGVSIPGHLHILDQFPGGEVPDWCTLGQRQAMPGRTPESRGGLHFPSVSGQALWRPPNKSSPPLSHSLCAPRLSIWCLPRVVPAESPFTASVLMWSDSWSVRVLVMLGVGDLLSLRASGNFCL